MERDVERISKARFVAVLLGASALATPLAAGAATPREADLVARLERLEAEMAELRAELRTAKAEQAETAQALAAAETRDSATATKVAALESRPQAAPQADGMKLGSTNLKIGGYLKLIASNSRYSDGELATNSLGRDFYLPQQIPTGNGKAYRDTDFTAKQSRLWLNLTTDVAGHTLKGYLETDFQVAPGTQGSQRTTNGYNLALRRAYLQFDKWTFGQDWSTFQFTGALPESTDYVGATEGTVFVRQPLIRYSHKLSPELTLHLAVENGEGATAVAGNAALVENGDDRLPDFVGRLAWAGKQAELSLAGVVRQVRVENAGVGATTSGWGASAAGKVFLNTDKTADARFMVTYGRNIGRYVGLNFGPDAVYLAGTNRLEDVNVFAALGAVRIPLAPNVRANLMGSYQSLDYADSLTAANIAGFNRRAWSAAANVFWSPVKQVDLGIEVRHGERDLVGGANGALDRIEFAAKYSF